MKIQIAIIALITIVSIVLIACGDEAPPVNNRWINQNAANINDQNQQKNAKNDDTIDVKAHQAIVKSNNQFAFDLYAKFRGKEGNQFFSPYSISSALAMTATGARGETEKQMIATLRLPTDKKQILNGFAAISKNLNNSKTAGAYQLSIANALWNQTGFDLQKDFIDDVKKSFEASASQLDFKTTLKIRASK